MQLSIQLNGRFGFSGGLFYYYYYDAKCYRIDETSHVMNVSDQNKCVSLWFHNRIEWMKISYIKY